MRIAGYLPYEVVQVVLRSAVMKRRPWLLLLALFPASAHGTTLFSSGFDTDLGFASEASTADHSVEYGYDYSANGIPSAPNGSGTIGLKIRSNIADNAANGVAVYTTSGSFTGQYRVSFDLFISNAASGTTEFIGGGVGFSAGSGFLDGAVLIGSSDGDSGRDFRYYSDGTEDMGMALNNTDDTPTNAFPGAGGNAPGTLAFTWHTMEIDADTDAQTASFRIDGNDFGTISGVDVSGGVSLVYADLFSSLANPSEDAFGVYDNLVVTQIPEPSSAVLLLGGFLALCVRRRRQ